MSVRRRNVRERVEREKRQARGRAAINASLAHMQEVLDELKAEGATELDEPEFWRRVREKESAR
jgi:hypothetical protein